MTHAFSGRGLDEITVEAAASGALSIDDVRISADTLLAQAAVAEQHGSPQLADNLRRGAELTRLADDDLFAVYEALRPGRSSQTELASVADDLERRGAVSCALLVREAVEVYARRGLLK